MKDILYQARHMHAMAIQAGYQDPDLIWYTNLQGLRLLYEEVHGSQFTEENPLRPLRFIEGMTLLGIPIHCTPIAGPGLTLVEKNLQRVVSAVSFSAIHHVKDSPL